MTRRDDLAVAAKEAVTRLEYSADTFEDQGCLTRADACRAAAAKLREALAGDTTPEPAEHNQHRARGGYTGGV